MPDSGYRVPQNVCGSPAHVKASFYRERVRRMALHEYDLIAFREYIDSACDEAYGRRDDLCGRAKIVAYRERVGRWLY